MDRRERYENSEERFRQAFATLQARLWTALPCLVTAYPGAAGAMTLNAQPAILGQIRGDDGDYAPLQMPVLLDCPILWQGGGGATLTFPVKPGDECLVVFSSRCIDSWFANGWLGSGNAPPPSLRLHSLSDGFALVGVRNNKRAYTPSHSYAELRTDTGETYVRLDPAGHIVTVTAPGGINLNGVTIDSSGNLTSPATITGTTEVTAKSGGAAVHLSTHKHSGVSTGSNQSGAPVGGT